MLTPKPGSINIITKILYELVKNSVNQSNWLKGWLSVLVSGFRWLVFHFLDDKSLFNMAVSRKLSDYLDVARKALTLVRAIGHVKISLTSFDFYVVPGPRVELARLDRGRSAHNLIVPPWEHPIFYNFFKNISAFVFF